MYKPLVVSRLQASCSLRDDVYDSVGSQPLGADDLVEGQSRQEGHHKERPLAPLLLGDAEVENVYNIGMTQRSQNRALPPEQFDLLRIQHFLNRLQRDVALHFTVNGAIHDAHA